MTTPAMSRSRGSRYFYLALCVPGFFWLAYYFAQGVTGTDMLRGMFATPSVSFITADLLLVALVGVGWMTVEARRLGMRWPLYLALAIVAPFAMIFPFFLYRREVVLDTLPGTGS